MLCLFRNSRIAFPLSWLVLALSLAGTFYWLHFAFIEKAFLAKMLAGEALFVDLLLGLPVVLVFALVIYAMIFWSLKVVIIFLWPSQIIQLPNPTHELSDELDPSLEEDYWQRDEADRPDAESPNRPNQLNQPSHQESSSKRDASH
ncbi:MAG: hypothetical protein ACP5D0_07660 [Hydrogenovibrio sp.]